MCPELPPEQLPHCAHTGLAKTSESATTIRIGTKFVTATKRPAAECQYRKLHMLMPFMFVLAMVGWKTFARRPTRQRSDARLCEHVTLEREGRHRTHDPRVGRRAASLGRRTSTLEARKRDAAFQRSRSCGECAVVSLRKRRPLVEVSRRDDAGHGGTLRSFRVVLPRRCRSGGLRIGKRCVIALARRPAATRMVRGGRGPLAATLAATVNMPVLRGATATDFIPMDLGLAFSQTRTRLSLLSSQTDARRIRKTGQHQHRHGEPYQATCYNRVGCCCEHDEFTGYLSSQEGLSRASYRYSNGAHLN